MKKQARPGRGPGRLAFFISMKLMGESMEDRQKNSLYDPRFEHDACGIGAVVDLKGGRSHKTVSDALSIVEKLRHRAGRDASGETGDGVGILL